MSLDELEKLARAALPKWPEIPRYPAVSPQTILALIAVIRAADAILGEESDADVYCIPAIMDAYEAARRALGEL